MSNAEGHDAEWDVTMRGARFAHSASSTARAPVLDPALQQRLGPLSDATRRRVESVVVTGFTAGLLDYDTALDLARGLQWAHSGRAPALTLAATVHELTGVSWPDTQLRRISRAAATSRAEHDCPPARRPAGSVRCPDNPCCESCTAAQQLVDTGRRIATALIVIDTLQRCGTLPAAQQAPAAGTGAWVENAGVENAGVENGILCCRR